jgi:16S rRNA (guanine527-N7)-methyltransferase
VDTATIARLLRPFIELDQKQLVQTSDYLDLLLKWNAKINLTSVRAPEEIITRHFGESFFAANRLLPPSGASQTVIDLGSGAGFPGLPLAMLAPTAQVTLLDSNARKAAFLNEAIHTLGLTNVKTVCQRGEDYPHQVDLVTMRAVDRFESALPVAVALVREGGRLALMVGAAQVSVSEVRSAGMNWQAPFLVPGSHSRVLLVGTKTVKVE